MRWGAGVRASATCCIRPYVREVWHELAGTIEGDDIPGRGTVGTEYELEQRYVLFAYSPCDPKHPNVAAHKAIRDIKRAVFLTDGKADPRWGRRVVAVRYLGRAIGPRTDGVGFVLSAVEIAVDYVEVLAKPA